MSINFFTSKISIIIFYNYFKNKKAGKAISKFYVLGPAEFLYFSLNITV